MPESPRPKKLNVRNAEIKAQVEQQVREHYDSELVDQLRQENFMLQRANVELYMAQSFGFCNGVRRAIDIAYAARIKFPTERIWLIGEIIHNPEVNARLDALGLVRLPWRAQCPDYNQIAAGDVVLIPAFGVTVGMKKEFLERGAQLVDSTCGHVMKVWQKVDQYAKKGITSIIHGKTKHEESMGIASHSRGKDGQGRFVVVFNEQEAQVLADAVVGKISGDEFLAALKGSYSVGFNPEEDLQCLGMANQTTMLRGETYRIQKMLRAAVIQRDGDDLNFQVCDTICNATQDRQNALTELLDKNLDAMFIVGGYNSSNTTHLAHIAQAWVPTYFIASADCIESLTQLRAYNLTDKQEQLTTTIPELADCERMLRIGITAGASCPANLIEQVISRILELRESSAEHV